MKDVGHQFKHAGKEQDKKDEDTKRPETHTLCQFGRKAHQPPGIPCCLLFIRKYQQIPDLVEECGDRLYIRLLHHRNLAQRRTRELVISLGVRRVRCALLEVDETSDCEDHKQKGQTPRGEVFSWGCVAVMCEVGEEGFAGVGVVSIDRSWGQTVQNWDGRNSLPQSVLESLLPEVVGLGTIGKVTTDVLA